MALRPILKVVLDETKIKMSFIQDGVVIDSETALYYHNLDNVLTPLEVSAIRKKGVIIKGGQAIYGELLTGLITALDKLLKRNSIDATALKSFKIGGNTGKNSTSYKIAAAFVEGLRAGA